MVFIRASSAFVAALHYRPQLKRCSLVSPTVSERRSHSSFHGCRLAITQAPLVRSALQERSTVRMVVDPWSVSPATIDSLATQLFSASLVPYLAFLYYLNRPSVRCPPLANFGFRFLLVFVFATIPAGIYAKVHYHDILANVDILHGAAESLLTMTNLLIVLGFRRGIQGSVGGGEGGASSKASKSETVSAYAAPVVLGLLGGFGGVMHAEPANALSFPTWIIHVSSLIEWLVGMGLVWRYGDVTGNRRWKGLTWGMIPLHTSGICACTYHLFYNAGSLNSLVALQALLTCFGNGTMAYAAYRLSQDENEGVDKIAGTRGEESGGLVGFEDLADDGDSDLQFLGKVFLISALGSAGVKWGELLLDAPFQGDIGVALWIVGVPTALNMLKWGVRSGGNEKFRGLF